MNDHTSESTAIIAENAAGQIVLVSPGLFTLFGLAGDPATLVDADVAELDRELAALFTDPARFRERMESLRRDPRLVSDEEMVTAAGRHLQRDFLPLVRDGASGGQVIHYRDVTERRRAVAALAESESRYRLVAQSASDGILTIDHDSVISYANPAVERMFGYDAGDLLGQPMTILVPEELRSSHRAGVQRYLSTGERKLDWSAVQVPALRRDGTTFPIEVSFGEHPAGESSMFTGIIRDVTERERVQAALEAAKHDAEQASRAKSQFLAVTSHEIRTPLNALMGAAELAAMSAEDDEQAELMHVVTQNSEVLLALISDVLDFAKIEAGQLELNPAPFELRRMVEGVCALLAPRAPTKGLDYTLEIHEDAPEALCGDVLRLRQIMLNLIGNALKFTDEGGIRVQVRTESGADGINTLVAEVVDTGIGVDAAEHELIFNRFYQSSRTAAKRPGGSGLGLSIARSLAEEMGGRLEVESEEGRGSKFRLSVPAAVAEYEVLQTDGGDRAAVVGSGRVLVIDDNASTLAILEKMLRLGGYDVETASSGTAGLEMAADGWDLVLMDLHMPGLDGFETTRRLREQEEERPGRAVPIVAVTADVVRGVREQCLAAGMNDYLAKPVQFRSLMRMVRRWTSGRESEDLRGAQLPVMVDADILDLIPPFLQACRDEIGRIQDLLAAGDFLEIKRIGHNLKGSGAGYGFAELSALGADLERQAGDEEQKAVRKTSQSIAEFLENTRYEAG